MKKGVFLVDINFLSPYIRVAMDSIINSPWKLTERVIYDYELLYVKEGKIKVIIENETYDGQPGDIFIFRPKQRHSIEIIGKDRLRQPHIHFDLFYQHDSAKVKVSFKPIEHMDENELQLFRDDSFDRFEVNIPNKISLRNSDYFEKMLFDIIKEHQMKLPYYEINTKGLFVKLWVYLLREFYWLKNPEVYSHIQELERIKDYLSFHSNRELSLDELVKEFNISKFHLTKLFKRAFSMTPIHYHQHIRMEKAKEMIQFTDISFTKIADIFGFSSINAFSRAFRNMEGIPPSFYRRKD